MAQSRYTLGTAEELAMDPAGGKWCIICEKHHTVANFTSKEDAERRLHNPGFCEECEEEGYSEEGRRFRRGR